MTTNPIETETPVASRAGPIDWLGAQAPATVILLVMAALAVVVALLS